MKTAYGKLFVMALLALALSFQGCKRSGGGFEFYYVSPSLKPGETCLPLVSKSDPLVVDIEEKGQFSYSLDLGDSSKDVCFIFTNPDLYNAENSVVVNSQRINLSKADYSEFSFLREKSGFDGETLLEYARKHGLGLRGTPEISEFNANPPKLAADGDARLRASKTVQATKAVGDKETFYNLNGLKIVQATLKHIISASGVTVNIWASDDSFGENCRKVHCMSPDMINQFGNKFLQEGTENDIYDWVVDIVGEPWGQHNFPDMISPAAASQIDILFYDIENDNSIAGGVLGFFWSKDNYTDISNSHKRLMFYMDSVMSATPCLPVSGECSPGDFWEIDDYWPSEMVSTLAHEFQHMIYFYQKQVKGDRDSIGSSKLWINEMVSMVAEDLLANKILVNGPRGVAYYKGDPGLSDNETGRLPRYNYYNYEALSNWYSGMDSLVNYSLSYSFGAYLARNYGGAAFFRRIVQNQYQYGDYQDVVSALESSGYYAGSSDVFADVLKDWGIAVLLSNRTDAPEGRRYNTGGYFTSSSEGGIEYNLGSINLYNYCFGGLGCGPRGLSMNDLNALNSHFKTSNTYVKWGSGLTGPLSLEITLPDNIKMTAVIADSE